MKFLVCIVFLLPAILAEKCVSEKCTLEKECVCTSHKSPIAANKTPQFVLLTFDDAVTRYIYDTYYIPLLTNRMNPDGNPISATFFVPHEYTDYECVNKLYNKGFEIAVHSISKSGAEYWKNAETSELIEEFSGQKQILTKFANIKEADIRGARVPFLEIAGNKTFIAYRDSKITYDSSWTTRSTKKLFPYTLDYESTQDCLVGSCPTISIPKFFISPINNIVGKNNEQCNALFGCQQNKTADGIKDWLVEQFSDSFNKERTPFKLLVNSVWLSQDNNFVGFRLFLDELKSLKEVFIVSESTALEWTKKPVPVGEYKTTYTPRTARCEAVTCALNKGEEEIRYMRSCVSCPKVYPWLKNPLGN